MPIRFPLKQDLLHHRHCYCRTQSYDRSFGRHRCCCAPILHRQVPLAIVQESTWIPCRGRHRRPAVRLHSCRCHSYPALWRDLVGAVHHFGTTIEKFVSCCCTSFE